MWPPPDSVAEGCLTPHLVPQPSWQLHPSAAGFSIFQIFPHPDHSPELRVHGSVATPTISLWAGLKRTCSSTPASLQWVDVHSPSCSGKNLCPFYSNLGYSCLQGCIRIRCIAKRLSYTHMHTHSFLGYSPISGVTECWVAFPGPYTKQVLVTYLYYI